MRLTDYHRAYRFLARRGNDVGWAVCAGVLPDVLLLVSAPFLLHLHGELAITLLEWLGVPVASRTIAIGGLTAVVPDVEFAGVVSPRYAAVVAAGGLLLAGAALVPMSRLNPLRVFAGVIAAVTGVSGAFFYFAGGSFPYTLRDFAAAWTGAELVIWLIAPLIMATVLGPLPLHPGTILKFSFMTIGYAFWLSVVRLTLLLAFLRIAGAVWMAPLYFFAGFLVDFIYIVGFYSVAVSRTTRRLREQREVWQW